MSKCNHQWHALAGECAICGKPIEKHIEELEAQLDRQKDEYEGLLDVAESNYKKLEEQLADMTLARDELQKMHDITLIALCPQ
jgi:hypothetical protein